MAGPIFGAEAVLKKKASWAVRWTTMRVCRCTAHRAAAVVALGGHTRMTMRSY